MSDIASGAFPEPISEESSKEFENSASSPAVPICKLDWYQTETCVVLSVLAKNAIKEKVSIKFKASEIDMTLAFEDGNFYQKTVHLYQEIIPDKCSYKVLSSKIEIQLPKQIGTQWPALEKGEKKNPKQSGRNWDKYVSEIEEEKLEGEAVLNALFQKIYSEGSDEVKKAMNKSFIESGGTELNTNWDAVSKGRVTVKPPEGMEWKSWDQ